MRNRKAAVFVEGQTELVFVREFLLQWFQYDANLLGFECYNLLEDEFCYSPYKYGDGDSENYYLIVNVGNDNSVLSKIRSRLDQMVKQNYQFVIGLRDMYCKQYVKESQRQIIEDLNCKYLQATQEIIDSTPNGHLIRFHFAIMEIESWLLGMQDYLLTIDRKLTTDYIKDRLGIDLSKDPEITLFHPAKELGLIYAEVGKTYNKHETDIQSIMSKLNIEDFLALVHSGKCATFKSFIESLLDQSF